MSIRNRCAVVANGAKQLAAKRSPSRHHLFVSSAFLAISTSAPALAQDYSVGGGTLTVSGPGGIIDKTGIGLGIAVETSSPVAMNGVTIVNTGSSSDNAYQQTALNADAVLQTTGANSLSGTPYSTAMRLVSNTRDAVLHIAETDANSTLNVAGAYGIVLAATGRAELIDYGSGIGGLRSVSGMNTGGYGISASGGAGVKIALKSPTLSGHARGINATGPTVDIALAGGSISAIDYGVSAASAAGVLTLDSAAAISADTGILASSGSGAVSITSRAAVNARTTGAGSGIRLTSAGPLAITSAGSIGASNAFAIGIESTVTGGLAASRTIAIDALVRATTGVATAGASHTITIGSAGSIDALGASGVGISDSAGSTIINNGSITSAGAGVRLANGGNLTSSGSIITSGVAIELNGAGAATVTLAVGSATNGAITSLGAGGRTLTIAGALNGGYTSSGASADTVTVARTGVLTGGIALGSGDDSFIWQGGALAGVDGGAGTDSFNVALGTGNVGTITVGTDATAFERYNLTSGVLSLRDVTGATTLSVTGEAFDESILQLINASGLTGDLYLNSRARLLGSGNDAFGSGTIHMANSVIQFQGSGSHANAISLESASATDLARLVAVNGAITLSGSIRRGGGATDQGISFAGGDYSLTNATNSWSGTTEVGSTATLRGTTSTISGGRVTNAGNLVFSQSTNGTFAAGISGAGILRIDAGSSARVTLSGASTYSGATEVNTGTLVASGGAAIGDNSTVTVASGATFEIAGAETIGGLAGSGKAQLNAHTLSVGANNTNTIFSGNITDADPLVYIGSWNVSDGPAWSSYPHPYTAQEAAALLFGGNAADYRTSTAGSDGAAINDLAWYSRFDNPVYVQEAANHRVNTGGAGYDTRNDTSAYVGDNPGTHINYAFTGGVHRGGGLTKTGTGTLTLSGTNDYAGLTSILAGTLAVQGGSAISNAGAVSVDTGAGFSVLGSETIATLTGGGTTTIAGSNALTLANASGTYTGVITGGGLAVVGGNWTFGGKRGDGNASGIQLNGAAATMLNVTTTGMVQGGQFAGVHVSTSGATIVNRGEISNSGLGGDGGLGAAILAINASGATTITHHAGGLVSGLNYGVLAIGDGGVTLVSSGQISGGIAAISLGNGADSVTLEAESITAGLVALGGGNDTLLYRGGSYYSVIDGGTGSDSFISDIGAGNTDSLVLGTLRNFESYTASSGDLTLTGGRSGGTGWRVTGGTLALADNTSLIDVAGDGVALALANAQFTIGSDAKLSAASGLAVRAYEAGASITNNGTIQGSGGDLTDAIYADASLSLLNSGAIHGITNAASTARTEGIYVNGALTLTNTAGAEITGGWVGVRGLSGGTIGNAGLLSGNVFAGAELTGAFTVTNLDGGMIRGNGGSGSGLLLDGGAMTVDNQAGATILGEGLAGIYTRNAGATTITNDGTIQGTGAAHGIRSEIDGLLAVANSGTISGGVTAISATGQASITNSGTINGAIQLGASNDSVILTAGSVNGGINLGAGSDTLTLDGGRIGGAIDLGAGDDIFNWNGGSFAGALDGGAGGFDTFNVNAATPATLELGRFAGFESQNLLSGTLTLVNGRDEQFGWSVSGAGSAFNIGSATQTATWSTNGSSVALSGTNTAVTIGQGSTVSSFGGYVVDATGQGATITNAGGISAQTSAVRMTGAGGVLTNSGSIARDSVGTLAAIEMRGADSQVTNLAGGTITGGRGIEFAVAGAIANAGTITATNDIAVNLRVGGTLTNTGTITALAMPDAIGVSIAGSATIVNGGTIEAGVGIAVSGGARMITNTGTIDATQHGVFAFSGATTVVNSGSIIADNFYGVALSSAGGTLTNSGAITGGSDATLGYGVTVLGGNATITNVVGGSIAGGAGAMALRGNGRIDVQLLAGSIVTGDILSTGAGTRNLVISGTLNGMYDASASTGIDTITLHAGGTLGSANLGAGDDIFHFFGGTITGIVDGGTGMDTLFGDFGAGGSGTLVLDHFVNFDAFGLASGDMTITGSGNNPGAAIYAGNGLPAGTVTFIDTAGLSGDIFVNGATIRTETAGGFGTGTIHLIDPTAVFGATGSYVNNISLEVQTPSTADPATLRTDPGVVATLTGAITQGTAPGVDPAQELVIAGNGTIVLTNVANSWAGTTTIGADATLQGTSETISGGTIVVDGALVYAQPGSGTVTQGISGAGSVTVAGLAAGQALTFAGSVTADRGVTLLGGGALVNAGTIAPGSGFAVELADGGTLRNDGAIVGRIRNAGTDAGLVVNTGTISGAVVNVGGAFTLENQGVLSGGAIAVAGNASTIRNAGDIAGTTLAVDYRDGVADIANAGRIVGGTLAGGGYTIGDFSVAVSIASGTIDNRAGGLITGGAQAIAATGTLAVTNQQGAMIEGGIAINVQGVADITNAGTIRGTRDVAINLGAGGTVTNSGLIESTGWAVNAANGLTLVNAAGGTITGGAGAIGSFGATTIDLQAGSTTTGTIGIVDTGASSVRIAGAYTGTLSLGDGDGTLELVSGLALGSGTALYGDAGADALLLSGAGDQTLDTGMVRGFETAAMNGSATWTLSGTAASANGWQVNSGTLALSGGSAVYDLASVTIASGASLQLLSNETIGALGGAGSVDLGINTLGLAATSSFAGTIGGTGGVTILNGVNVTLSGANSYTGTTQVAFGALTLGNSNVLADAGTLVVDATGTLDLQGYAETVALAQLAGRVEGTGTLTAGQYQLTGATVNANLGTGKLFQTGATSTLNGSSAATLVAINDGTLALGAADRLLDSAQVAVAAGATFDIGGNSDTIGLLALGGTLAGSGTLTAQEFQFNSATVNANLSGGTVFQLGGTSTLNGSVATNVAIGSGTLALGAADRIADGAIISVATDATLDLAGFNDTVAVLGLAGTLAGTGTLTAGQYQLNGATVSANLGAGTLFNLGGISTLTGAAAASDVRVQAGTLRLSADDRLAATAAMEIGTNASFDLANHNQTIGALLQASDGAGTLALGTGRLTLGGTAESAFGGKITGSGSIDMAGTGRLTLAGAFDMTGRIDVSAGSLAFFGSSAGAMRLQGGMLTGAGTLAGNLAIASGSFAPGGPMAGGVAQPFARWAVGSLTVSGGTLAFDVGGRSSGFVSDQILVRDAAVLSGGTLQISTTGPASDYVFSRDYVLIQAGSLSGSFANGSAFDAVSNDDSLKWRLRYDLVPNAVVLQLQKALDFVEALPDGASANQFAVAGALNGSAGLASDAWATTLNEIAALDFGARPATYDTMSGEAIADLSTSTMLANRLFSDLLRQQIGSEDGLTGAAFAQNTGSAVRSAATDPGSKVNLLAASQEASGGGTRNGALWTQAFGGYQRLRGQAGQANVASSVGGVAMGAEVRLGAITLGAAGAVSEVDGDVDARFSRTSGTLYQAGGYAGYSGGIAFASLSGTWYGGDFTTQRTILLGGAAGSARGETHSEGYSFGATAGLRFDLGGGMRAALIASGTQTHDVRDGFVEEAGGGLGLEAGRASRDLFTATGEVRLGQQIRTGSGSAMPFVSLGVRVNSGDLDTLGTMRLAGAPTGLGGFTVEGARLSPVTGIVGTGIDAKVSDRFSLGVAAEAGFGGRTREGRASLRLRWGF